MVLQKKKIENSKKQLTISMETPIGIYGETVEDRIEYDLDEPEYNHNIEDMKAELVKQYILELKSPYKEVIYLREIKKWSYIQIEKKLNMNINTVKTNIRIGRNIIIEASKNGLEILERLKI